MTIKYSGTRKYNTDDRCAIITYKNGKEEEKADKIITAIEDNGYSVELVDCDETTEIYVSVWDRDEYEDVKNIYTDAKTA